MVKTVGKYELYRTLGEGSFGKVKYAVNKETNEAVAIKILDKEKIQKQNMGAQIKKEISIMKMINHQYVVCVKDVFATTSKIFLVLELVEGGELFDKISSQGRLSEEQARFYFRQVAEGLDYCHSQGVCHRDLKPENLLLDSNGNIKISDFGLSALYVGDAEAEGNGRAELLHTTCGTPNYVAPEVLANHGYDGKRADVWSMGVILYVLLAGFLPFEENTMVALFLKIKNADYSYPGWFSPVVRALLGKVLVADPTKRMTLSELKVHPWLVEGEAYPDNNKKGKATGTNGNGTTSEAVEQSRREVAEAHPNQPAPVNISSNLPDHVLSMPKRSDHSGETSPTPSVGSQNVPFNANTVRADQQSLPPVPATPSVPHAISTTNTTPPSIPSTSNTVTSTSTSTNGVKAFIPGAETKALGKPARSGSPGRASPTNRSGSPAKLDTAVNVEAKNQIVPAGGNVGSTVVVSSDIAKKDEKKKQADAVAKGGCCVIA